MNLLAIETSCDETAIAIMNFDKEQSLEKEIEFSVLSNHVLSQINIHREFGGVFPNLAKREHANNIVKIFTECLKEAGLYKENINKIEVEEEKLIEVKTLLERESEMYEEILALVKNIQKPNIEAISVTMGPGLAPALWIGINFAKALAIFWNIKIYAINHMEGHIVSALVSPISENKYIIKNIKSPSLALLISGGHTEIIYFDKLGEYKKVGKTLDDAVGEAFDKVARSLELPYPGGPEISKLAEASRQNGLKIIPEFKLPRPMIHSGDLNFSFSGLKTAVIYKIKELEKLIRAEEITGEDVKNIISLDFENAVTEVLIKKIKDALDIYKAGSLLIGGGVIANTHIRKNFIEFTQKENIDLYLPERFLTGDNAFMIGTVAILEILKDKDSSIIRDIRANSNWSVENI